MFLKVYNGRMILAMRDLVVKNLKMKALELKPQPHESPSNESVENGIRMIKDLLKMHILALDHKLRRRVLSKHPLMAWLLEHVADVATKYLCGSDGRTAYERLFGKAVHEEGVEFEQRVLYKKRPSKDSNVFMQAK